MSSPIRIRVARSDDAERIHELVVALAEYEREPDAVELRVSVLRDQLASESPPFECLLAETEPPARRVVGFALFFHTYSTWRGRRGLYLEDLFVEPLHRGRGVGRALLGALARARRRRSR